MMVGESEIDIFKKKYFIYVLNNWFEFDNE